MDFVNENSPLKRLGANLWAINIEVGPCLNIRNIYFWFKTSNKHPSAKSAWISDFEMELAFENFEVVRIPEIPKIYRYESKDHSLEPRKLIFGMEGFSASG